MTWVILFGVAFALIIVALIRSAIKAGPRELEESIIARGQRILAVDRNAPGDGWQKLGRLTQADGLNLKFEHNDDPAAEATMLAPGVDPDTRPRSTLANNLTVTLPADFKTIHCHTSGYVFQVRLRGAHDIVGKEVRIQMVVNPKTGEPYGGRIENDDDTDAAVGGWIEIESAEILKVAA